MGHERDNPRPITYQSQVHRVLATQPTAPAQRNRDPGGQSIANSGDVLLHDSPCRPAAGDVDRRLRHRGLTNRLDGLQTTTASQPAAVGLVQGRGRAGAGVEQPDETCLATTSYRQRFLAGTLSPNGQPKQDLLWAGWGFVDIQPGSSTSVRFCPRGWSLLGEGAGAAHSLLLRGWLFLVALVWVFQRFANCPSPPVCSKAGCSAAGLAPGPFPLAGGTTAL